MKINYDPFSHIFEGETQINPNARIIRSSFKEKLFDTCVAFHGSAHFMDYIEPKGMHHQYDLKLGILDYCGLIIFRGFMLGCLLVSKALWDNGIWLALIPTIIAFGCVVAAFIADIVVRALLTLTMTVIALPLVAIVHMFAEIKHYFVNSTIKQAADTELTTNGLPANYDASYDKKFINKGDYTLCFYSTRENFTDRLTIAKIKNAEIEQGEKQDISKASSNILSPHSFYKTYTIVNAVSMRKQSALVAAMLELNEDDFEGTQRNCI